MLDLHKINPQFLLSIVPRASGKNYSAAQVSIAGHIAPLVPDLFAYAALTSSLRIAHFLAQLAHESDSFKTAVEYASGRAYEGRADLGNTRAGDGVRYKGHGLIQLTGHGNHRAFTLWMRKIIPGCPDFEAHPELVAEFPWALWAAIYFWMEHGLNRFADRDDLIGATRVINGGTNGLEDRRQCLGRAKTGMARLSAGEISIAQEGFEVLHRGSEGRGVAQLQRGLFAAGYSVAIDGDFGPGTETAVRMLQKDAGLTVDGIVGANTFAALKAYMPPEV
ncbi:peptidoglycan-binding protein [Rhizobium halophytocola]|uniref:Chitinase n=1 Tax=Rhizobium halophytocola TaxID=735519 RepID=A0ABS4E456_9HYPH|nr:peptidoglycan-binding protein [Rhizobium halophytocola]MBP1852703.1 putative chitinase [Rhizobium halophytocola]